MNTRIVAKLDVLQSEANAMKRLHAETFGEKLKTEMNPAILDNAFKGDLRS